MDECEACNAALIAADRGDVADDGVMFSLNNKGMYNHVADFCEHWNEVVDICNGRRGPHSPANATQRQTSLLETLAWFSRWKELHDKRVKEKHTTKYIFLQMKLVLHQIVVAKTRHSHAHLL